MPTLHTVTNNFGEHTFLEYRFPAPLIHKDEILNSFELTATECNSLPKNISIFAREIVRKGNENCPRLVFFQGGPGFSAPRPEPISGWIDTALNSYRVVLLDQRGTGQSHPLDRKRILAVGSAQLQAAYLACFRADSIVADAELLRALLQPEDKWTIMGQSFGGFCVTTYLSQGASGLNGAMITAGLTTLNKPASEVYRLTWQRTEKRNQEFFARYPQDETTCWKITKHLAEHTEILPTGERLTPRKFRTLGINLGRSYGFETLHHLLENPFIIENGQTRLHDNFLANINEHLSFAGHPLYWALHESIYGQKNTGATAWSADTTRAELPQFRIPDMSVAAEVALQEENYGFRFSGEHVFAWQAAEDSALAGLEEAVDLLAQQENFPPLYDLEVLAHNTVPVVAWIYTPDMFVPAELSLETAQQINGLIPLISTKFHHDALRTESDTIMNELLKTLKGEKSEYARQ